MVDRDGSDVHELRQIILIRHIVAMPGYYVKRRVLLCALEELPTQLINYLPAFLLNFILGHWVQEVSRVGESVSTQRSEFGELEVRAPDFCEMLTIFSHD